MFRFHPKFHPHWVETRKQIISTAPASVITNENTKGNTASAQPKSTAPAAVTKNQEEADTYEEQMNERRKRRKQATRQRKKMKSAR